MITPELWAKLTPERQLAYVNLVELTEKRRKAPPFRYGDVFSGGETRRGERHMRECGEPEVIIHGFPELGEHNKITVDLSETPHYSNTRLFGR